MKRNHNRNSTSLQENDVAIKKGRSLNPFVMVIISFAGIILLGTILLFLPFSQTGKSWSSMFSSGWAYNLVDCFFTAVSATCVTGLNVFENGIGADFTFFGQLVVLIMIQIGGLGFITVFAFLVTIFSRRIKFKNKLFLARATNSTSFGDVVGFVRRVVVITAICEIIGVFLLFPVFKIVATNNGEGGWHALWYSVFHSISAFCNAGFDVLGSTSLINTSGWAAELPTWAYNYLLIVTMILIIFGGISFIVIADVFSFKKPSRWRAFTKVVLATTGTLLVVGSLLLMLFECPNGMSPLDAIFQAVTCRTAGFASVDQESLTVGGRIVSCLLMFVGGSPISTAGGVKTTTIFIVVISLSSYITGKKLHAFNRSFSSKSALQALALICTVAIVLIIGYGCIAAIETSWNSAFWTGKDVSSMLLFECFSAMFTVGLSQNVTTNLVWGSKLVLSALMFIGRLGPMTMFQVFKVNMDKQSKLHYSYVEEDFLVG